MVSTAVLLAAGFTLCCFDWHLAVRIPLTILTGLLLVRMFVIYHDYEHGSILKKSKVAKVIMTFYGLGALNAPSIWARSHNHHHKNNCRLHGGFIGSFPTMTVQEYEESSFWQRVGYRISRHPVTIAMALYTVFLFGMTIRPLFINPRQHFDCVIALLFQAAIITLALVFGDVWVLLFAIVFPGMIASAVGAYLFYAQHNFPGVKLRDRAGWDHVFAAMHSSSYIPMSPVMAWFTGNIGYHHIHHLNHKIPFYNLPTAMDEFEELQAPGRTTLMPWDVAKCLRLKLWDHDQDRLISWGEYRALKRDQAATAAAN